MQTQWVGVRREVENCVPAASPLAAAVGSSTAAAAAAAAAAAVAAAVAGRGCGVVGVPGRYTTSTMIGAVPSCTAGWSAAAAAASSSFAATTTAVAVAAAAACSPTSCFSAAALSGNGSTLPEPSRCCWCDSDDALGCVDAAAASLQLLASSTPSGSASDVGGVTPLPLPPLL